MIGVRPFTAGRDRPGYIPVQTVSSSDIANEDIVDIGFNLKEY